LKALFNILLLFGGSFAVRAQTVDRKIIIQDAKSYCVTIDQRFQIGTLHEADLDDTLLTGIQYALPAGRSLLMEDKPLSWDINDSIVYAVSFLDHPMNDRNEAIKKIKRSSLVVWSSEVQPEAVIMHSIDHSILAYNEPYKYAMMRSNLMDNFYCDAIVFNGSYWMVISHQGEWYVWNYANGEWKHSDVSPSEKPGYFTLVVVDSRLKLISNGGDVYSAGLEGIRLEKNGSPDKSIEGKILIENRDSNTVLLLDKDHLDKEIPFDQLMVKFAQEL
jgi:hypothetical protein